MEREVRSPVGNYILNKDATQDLGVELDFGHGMNGAVETETLHAPALGSRDAHITTSTKSDSLTQGKCSVTVPHATGLRLTVDLSPFPSVPRIFKTSYLLR